MTIFVMMITMRLMKSAAIETRQSLFCRHNPHPHHYYYHHQSERSHVWDCIISVSSLIQYWNDIMRDIIIPTTMILIFDPSDEDKIWKVSN
jgi:hypothetical protein